jgi:hypothetical protein
MLWCGYSRARAFAFTASFREQGAEELAEGRTTMNATLLRGLVGLVPACVLLSGSIILFSKGKTVGSFLQLLGAGSLMVVIFCHISEGLHLFPQMNWGLEQNYR